MLKRVETLVKLLSKGRISYAIIGGIAVLLHGGRASTIDCDLYVLSMESDKLRRLLAKHHIPFQELGPHQIRANLYGLRIDILFDDSQLSKNVIAHRVSAKLTDMWVPIASPEDLIVLKTIANRPIDRRDIEELREIFGDKLDETYIQKQWKLWKKM